MPEAIQRNTTTASRRSIAAGSRRKANGGDALSTPPPMPPKTPEEIATSAEICRQLRDLTAIVRQQNLDRAIILAQMAARGRGPLIEHFAELGRRYAHLLREPQKTGLRVIRGGAD